MRHIERDRKPATRRDEYRASSLATSVLGRAIPGSMREYFFFKKDSLLFKKITFYGVDKKYAA